MNLKKKNDFEELCEKLKQHPFTLLSLSDREKFHAGFLAYTLNNNPNLFKEIFGLSKNKNLKAYIEKYSIDLIISCNNWDGKRLKENAKAIAEIKFKTDLHSNQLTKYSEKVDDIPKKLICLFDPAIMEPVEESSFVVLKMEDIVSTIERNYPISNNKSVNQLIELWLKYMRTLFSLIYEFIRMKIPDDQVKNLKSILSELKLLGIFELYKYKTFFEEIYNKIRNEEIQVKFDNTHGNALIDFFFEKNDHVNHRYGIQWQNGSVKLFVESNNGKIDIQRDDLLVKLAVKFNKKFKLDLPSNGSIKLNRNGKFRSVTLKRKDIISKIDDNDKETILKFIDFLTENTISALFSNKRNPKE